MIKNILLLFAIISHAYYAQNMTMFSEHIKRDNLITIEKIDSSSEIFKITDNFTGLSFYKSISEIKPTKSNLSVDTTIIDITEIDDSLYSRMYEFWFDTDISGQHYMPAPLADIDNDGNAEMYGHVFEVYNGHEIASDFVIFEFNPIEETFDSVHTFFENEQGGYYGGVYDINRNGNEQVCLVDNALGDSIYVQASRYYKNETENSLPTVVDFENIGYDQDNDHTYGDFNKNNITDLIVFHGSDPEVVIYEYNSIINNLETVFQYPLDMAIDIYGAGFGAEDIDGDGYPELTFASIYGNLYVFEYQPASESYELIFQDNVGINNAYLHFTTKDIDDNGKNEFWVGGDGFFNGQGITRFTCYEAIDDNQYEPVHVIDIYNIFSSYAGNMFPIDIDKDGKEEIFMCVDQNIFIFKFTGSPNHPSYDLYYHWHNPKANDEDWGLIYGARMYDLDRDGYEEIVINGKATTRPANEGFFRVESYIYRPTGIVSVEKESEKMSDYILNQNYPNPFNPTTEIKYQIKKPGFVSLKVYDILGKEVKTLVNEHKNAGYYSVTFDAGSAYGELSSGVYIYKLQAGNFIQTRKMVLLR